MSASRADVNNAAEAPGRLRAGPTDASEASDEAPYDAPDEAEAIDCEIDSLLLAAGNSLARASAVIRDRIIPVARQSLKSTRALRAQPGLLGELAGAGADAMRPRRAASP